ncbi:MAG: thioredoxin-dependent thiol peroxidase [Rhodothermales bacterium]|nr:thioredoxin-dependent thiol peroxidase [Rhodothermales bacterium]
MVGPGDPAPDFSLLADDGSTINLSDFRGKTVVLYFYPKDNTSGCTAQACEYRDHAEQFTAKDAVVLGVSPDGLKSHEKFRDKFDLNFPLLVDQDHAVAEAYGVWKEKSMYGRKYMGIERSTFVISPDGAIAQAFRKVKAKGDAERVLEVVE